MSGLTTSPRSETFPSRTESKIISPSTKPVVVETSNRKIFDSHDFTYPPNVPRHSTNPDISYRPEHHGALKDRRAQTGSGLQRMCSNRSHKSLWRRLLDGRHGKAEGFEPTHGCSRQSTIDTKNSESFEQTKPWDQKAILSLGE